MNKVLSIFTGSGSKSGFHKIKASILAVFLGLLVGTIPILASGGDPIVGYHMLFTSGLNKLSFNKFITYGCIFTLIGLGIGVSFKTGLFNIGATGQFMFAGAITTMMGITIHSIDKTIAIPLMVLVAALSGAIIAGIAGALKAFFNVHEVVSTILMNWSLFYLIKWIFLKPQFKGQTTNASKEILYNMKFDISKYSYDVWFILLMAMIVVVLVFLIFKFTTFGFSLRVNGLNKNAAKYGGINTKKTTILSMMLSGGIVGIAGFIFYSSVQGQMPSLDESLNTWGFEAITVTLLAFSSPLGMPIAGFFYAMMKISIKSAGLAANVSAETFNLVLGIIILFSALAPLIEKYKPLKLIYRWARFSLDKKTNKFRRSKGFDKHCSKQIYLVELEDYNLNKKQNDRILESIQKKWMDKVAIIKQEFKNKTIDQDEKIFKLDEISKEHKLEIAQKISKTKRQIKEEYKNRNVNIANSIKAFKLMRMDKIFSKAKGGN